ncbi:hypothetical protein F511_03706 [Dorcoceras hygrometricum]|uniref:Uncharacterized protein n=1 Tax=Dorcoceras hygrometricum TaxID=472368 RepID=A0A2Z7ABN1_9LAMI|nr:hypothetical protein F511_12242 [Dorcoceras hygrometricum]KZV32423.1 hypothetical protein F511_03706 [Dorcoceras hygrometricum]
MNKLPNEEIKGDGQENQRITHQHSAQKLSTKVCTTYCQFSANLSFKFPSFH